LKYDVVSIYKGIERVNRKEVYEIDNKNLKSKENKGVLNKSEEKRKKLLTFSCKGVILTKLSREARRRQSEKRVEKLFEKEEKSS